MDVVHPSYVEPHQFTGDRAWIKQVVEAQSVCLPIARITIDGPFGKLETEAAVSPSLPAQYPYLFSNRSDQLLRERGLVFGEGIVFALTRSKARELGAKAAVESRNDSRRKELEGERLQRENKNLEHEIQLLREKAKLRNPELELLLEKDLVVEESTVPALPVADARERESEATVAAEKRVKVAERDNDGALAQTVGRGQCVSTECDNVSAFVLEISAECSDDSNSREALEMATDLNMNISRDSEVSLECVNHGATERQHESAETDVVPSDGSTETSDVVAKPTVEAASGLHSSAGSHDDLATEQADSVLPTAQVADLEQQPAELVEIQVSRAAEPSFETGQLGSSVALTAAKQNENTLRCSLAEAVAESARDNEVVTAQSYQVPNEHVVPFSLQADAPDDRPTSAELVEVAVSTAAEPKSGTDQPRGENVNTFRCSLAERVREKASKKDRGKTSARACGACFSAGTRRGKAVSSHRARGTPPPRRSARLSFERWKISFAPPRARLLSKRTAGVLSRGRSSVQRTGAPKVRYKKGKTRSNDESSNRSSQREKWPVDA
ncbi:uncharacterized protein LOC144156099 [Haemaphysalis longicornis]